MSLRGGRRLSKGPLCSIGGPARIALACCTVVAATLVALAAPSGPAGADAPTANWAQLSPATSPTARGGPAMAYDPATGNMVLFGGDNSGGLLADTWTWNGTTWTQLSPATSPPARFGASMAYDPATGNMVLFGGDGTGGTYLSDTWTWNGTTWTKQTPATSPTARYVGSMDYDPGTGNMVLFGGVANGGGTLSDTWTWNGTNWSQLSPATSPTARYGATMAYDPATGTMVLFGGDGGSYLSDTWTWNGTTWSQQSPVASPPARQLATMAYDPATGTMVLFGGISSGSSALSDTWTWNGTTWSQLSPAASPPARWSGSMAYDPATGNMVLFGGINGGIIAAATWTYGYPSGTLSTWTQSSPSTSPPARWSGSMAYDPAAGNMVLFGGINGGVIAAATWTWNGTNWAQLSPATSPTARGGPAMAYDPATGNMVLFGGDNSGGLLADTWTWNGTTWTQLSPATSPPARFGASMAYDPATGNMVLFGGDGTGGTYLSDTWTWNGTTWTKQTPATSPTARYVGSMDYDPGTGNMVLFGGVANGGGTLSDTWTWNGTNWSQLSPATSPTARYGATMAYDPATGTMVLFGGDGGSYLSDTWTWNGTTWSQQSPVASPPARQLATMAYDPATGTMVLFGGISSGSSALSDTWTYGSVSPVINVSVTGSQTYGGSASFSQTNQAPQGVTVSGTVHCTTVNSGTPVSTLAVGSYTVDGSSCSGLSSSNASYSIAYTGATSGFSVSQATPTASISNLPGSGTYNGGFTATVSTNSNGTTSVSSSTTSVCTASGLTVSYVGVGLCTLTASVAAATDYTAATGSPQSFTVYQATPTVSISDLPASGTYGGGFTATVSTNSTGTTSVTSSTTSVCTASGLTVSYTGVGTCTLQAQVAAATPFGPATGSTQSFTVSQATPTASISNLPGSGTYGGGFTATVSTDGDGTTSVTSSTTSVCTVSGLVVSYVGVGPCTLTAHVAVGTDYTAADGSSQSFTVSQATPTVSISNLPGSGTYGGDFTATVSTDGDGTTSVTSSTTSVCTVSGLVVSYTGVGTCTLQAHVADGTDYGPADGPLQSYTVFQATPTVSISNLPASDTYGGGFTATVTTDGDGSSTSVTSSTTSVCTVSGLVVSYTGVGTCTLQAHVAAGTNFGPADGSLQSYTVSQATPTVSISNLPASDTYGNGFMPMVSTDGDGATSVTSSTTSVCTVSGLTVSYTGVGTCTLQAHVADGTNYGPADGPLQSYTVDQGTPTVTISNLPGSGNYGGAFTATVSTDGDGATSVTSSTTSVCTASGLTVSYTGVGTCTLQAHVADGTDYGPSDGPLQSYTVYQATPTVTISNLPGSGQYGGGFTATVSTTGDGTSTSVTSSTTGVCAVSGLAVSYVGAGMCTLQAHVAAGTDYGPADGNPQSFKVVQKAPTKPKISNLPASGKYGGHFTARISTDGDGTESVTSSTTDVCTASGLTVSYVGAGTCTLTAQVAAGTDYAGAEGSAQSFTIDPPAKPAISNIPDSASYGDTFTAVVVTTGDGVTSVTSSTTKVCTKAGLIVSFVGAGTCTLTAHVAAGAKSGAAEGNPQSFTVSGTPSFFSPATTTFVEDQPGTFTVQAIGYPTIMNYTETGTLPPGVTPLTGGGVLSGTPTAAGTFTVTITASNGVGPVATQTFTLLVRPLAITTPTLGAATVGKKYSLQLTSLFSNICDGISCSVESPEPPAFSWTNVGSGGGKGPPGPGTGATATTPKLPKGLTLSETGKISGTVAATVATGSYPVGIELNCSYQITGPRGMVTKVSCGVASVVLTIVVSAGQTPTKPEISNLPASGTEGGGFIARISTTGDGSVSITSSTPRVCTVAGLAVSYVGVGTCTLTPQVAAGPTYAAADGGSKSFSVG